MSQAPGCSCCGVDGTPGTNTAAGKLSPSCANLGKGLDVTLKTQIVQLICVAAVRENTRKRTRTSPEPKTAVVDSTWSADTFGQQAQPWFCVGNPGQCTRFLEGPRRAHAFNLGAFQCRYIYKSLLNALRPHHIGRGKQRSQPGRLAYDSRLARRLFRA